MSNNLTLLGGLHKQGSELQNVQDVAEKAQQLTAAEKELATALSVALGAVKGLVSVKDADTAVQAVGRKRPREEDEAVAPPTKKARP